MSLSHVPKSTLASWWQDRLLAPAEQDFLPCVMIECVCVMQRACTLSCIDRVLVFILPVHAAKVERVKFDTTQLHARPELAAEQRMVDDASGEIEVREPLWLTQDAIIVFPNASAFPHTAAVQSCHDAPTCPSQGSMAAAGAKRFQTPTNAAVVVAQEHFFSSS